MKVTKGKSSFQKSYEILIPMLGYYLVTTTVNMLLLMLLEYSYRRLGGSYQIWLTAHQGSVQGLLSGLAMLAGLLAVIRFAGPEVDLKRLFPRTPAGQGGHPLSLVRAGGYFLLGVMAVAAAMGINILFSLTGFTASSEAYGEVAEAQFGVSLGIGFIVYGILAPLAEEVVFRGIIYNRMKKYYPVQISMILSALLFGLYHGNMVQGLYGTIMGLLIVFVYYRFGTFAAPLVFHSLANISVFITMYWPDLFGLAARPAVAVVLLVLAAVIFLYFSQHQLNTDDTGQ